jgi:choline dehydrogenase-like flavoprotein
MATSAQPQVTDFTRDVLGRFVCNGLDEALASADPARPDTRPFDVIVLGGGSFGAVVAQHLFATSRIHRVLVLEGGPLLLPEHTQNLPLLGLNQPQPATSIAALRQAGQFGPDKPREQVWGLPWHSSTPFIGLAYCLGGRSLYWGGWSPRPLAAELPVAAPGAHGWPAAVVQDLDAANGYYRQASDQLGVTETNDFIFGPLQNALRQRLFNGLAANPIPDVLPLGALPDHPTVRFLAGPPTQALLMQLLGLSAPAGAVQAMRDQLKLEAPLAVQGRPPRSGYFPINKFSGAPLLISAARAAQADSGGADARKRLMVVPNCHIIRLATAGLAAGPRRVTALETNQGVVPVPPGAVVVIALGTIESARLACLSFDAIPPAAYALIGANLMAHLRSNLVVRIPRAALPAGLPQELQAAALFVKGQHTHPDGTAGHYHLQITAAGLGPVGANAEVELFQKVPDIDAVQAFQGVNDTHVVVHLRGIGEMEPRNAGSHVRLDPEADEFGARRAIVALADPRAPAQAANPASVKDLAVWDAMDAAALAAAQALGNGQQQVIGQDRDGLGTTHHEAGALWMGDDPAASVTNADGRFHHVANAYVAGPALFPTIGSPNPMLTGTALARRLADHLALGAFPVGVDIPLFDGGSVAHWRMSTISNQGPAQSDPGRFELVNGVLQSVPGNDIGLYWCAVPTPPDFVLTVEWLRQQADDNSGVFVRFPDPTSRGYNNTAYVGVDFGFEVQIDETGAPDGAAIHQTGAIYDQPGQALTLQPALPVGQWNTFEIRVQGQVYTVSLNGVQVSQLNNAAPNRGLATTANAGSFIGLQTYPGKNVAFRNIRLRAL